MKPAIAIPVVLMLVVGWLAPAAMAKTMSCVPEPLHPAVGQQVQVNVMLGGPFQGQKPEWPARLQRLWKSGRVALGTASGPGSELTFSASEPGVQLLAYVSGESDEHATFCKAIVVVGDAPRGERIWRSEVGQRLEIVPQTDPVGLVEGGGELEVQILFDREPLVGATVVAVPRQGAERGYRRAISDTRGRVRFDLDAPGPWLIHLAHKSLGPGGDPGGVLLESSLVLAVGPEP